ncbi:sensor histidine kinase [Schumannella soli]|uniref:histidine kinase n=1 Tax=Schumannella soli TaxID=2590779 RepID=A0A506Y840_9MICO|nr:sensor histidine kinase [Schumannella soli]TPW77670.1 sensor histidine kinase [Schumannella soli]
MRHLGWTIAVCVVVGAQALICAWFVFVAGAGSIQLLRGAVGLAGAVLLLVAWFTLGRRCDERRELAVPFAVIVVIWAAAATFAHPSFAALQCLAFPLIWMSLDGRRRAITGSVVLAVAVGIAMAQRDFVGGAIAIQVVSLVFAVVFGLWISGIAEQSEQRRVLLDELRATQDALAAAHRDAGVASERERLAREIHDTVAQDLTGLVLLAQQARRELERGIDPAQLTAGLAHLDALEDAARAALGEARALVASTASPTLEGGLAPALRRLAERFERETGVTVSVDVDVAAITLDRDREVVLIRCAQEALANVRKHAGATRVRLTLRTPVGDAGPIGDAPTAAIGERGAPSTTDAGLASLALEVHDDGAGFDATAPSPGFGLSGMRDRLALAGGALAVTSDASGTRVRATLPTGAPA